MKVTYTTADGPESTAYLDELPDPLGRFAGEDKYTDEPIIVQYDTITGTWYEIGGSTL